MILKYFKHIGMAVFSFASFYGSYAFAGPFENGMAAYQAKNYANAMTQFKQAAIQDHSVAQFNIGVMYAKGQGVPEDAQQAAYWYKKVAYKGIKDAQYSLGMIYFFGGVNLDKDYVEAGNWLEKAALQGHPKAQFRMGNIYDQGMGRPKDLELAFEWLSKAAEQNENRAQNNLGIMYAMGKGVQQNTKLATYWRKRAAENGNKKAIAFFKPSQKQSPSMTSNGMSWELNKQGLEKLTSLYHKSADGKSNVIAFTKIHLSPLMKQSTSSNAYKPIREAIVERHAYAKANLSQSDFMTYRDILYSAMSEFGAGNSKTFPPFLYNWLKRENYKP